MGGVSFTSDLYAGRFDGTSEDGRDASGFLVRIAGNTRVAWYGVIADCPVD